MSAMTEAEDASPCQTYSIALDALRKWEVFGDASDAKLRGVRAFYAFNLPSHMGCEGGAGIIFFTIKDIAFGQGHNCRNINMLGFPKSHTTYRSECVSRPLKIPGLSFKRIIHMSVGGLIGAAVSDCGTLFWWGNCYNRDGDIMTPHAPRSCRRKYLRVSCGYRLMAAVSHSRNVYVWGQLELRTARYLDGERLIVDFAISKISCGVQHLAMMDVHGYVYTWGRGDYGQRGLVGYLASDECTVTRISGEPCIDVKCGPFSTFCLTAQHVLKACGSNCDYHLGHLSRFRNGNSVAVLTKINLFGTVADFAVVWNEDYTATMAAKSADCNVLDLYTWGAGLSPYPKYSGIDSFFDIFAPLKVTPGLAFIRFLRLSEEFQQSSRKSEHRAKLVSDALVYIYLRDRPYFSREASQFLWKCRNNQLTYMANLIPREENGKDFVMEKFVTDLRYTPQLSPEIDDVCSYQYGSSQEEDSSYFSL